MGVSAGTRAAMGAFLTRAPFPLGYGLVFVGSAVSVGLGYRYSRTLRIPDRPTHGATAVHLLAPSRVGAVAGDRRRAGAPGGVARACTRCSPSACAWRCRCCHSGTSGSWVPTDAFIGLVGTVAAGMTMAGYFLWRRPARRFGGARVACPPRWGWRSSRWRSRSHTRTRWSSCSWPCTRSAPQRDLAIFDALMNVIPADRSVRFAALDTGAVDFAGVVAPLTGALLASALGLRPASAAAAAVELPGGGGATAAVVAGRRPHGQGGSRCDGDSRPCRRAAAHSAQH